MSDVRLRHKTIVWQGASVNTLKYRVGNNAANYLEWTSIRVGVNNEQCRNYENFKLNRATTVGTVNLTTIQWVEIEVVANASIPQGSIRFDATIASSWGFTLKNVYRGDQPFFDFRKQYEKPSTVIEDICKLQGIFWFIDYDRDLHIFKQNADPAPFQLDNSSQNRGDMSVSVDISMLKNRQTVRGGEAPAMARYIQDQRTDGLLEAWDLAYKPKDLNVYVAYQSFVITAASWTTWVATFTTSGAHGFVPGDQIAVTDITPNSYTGSYTIIATPLATTFTVAITANPGAYTSGWFVGKFVQKTVGIENLVDATTVNYVYNFQQKVVRRGNDPILPDGAVIRRDYFPYQAIRVRVKNQPSITAMQLLAWGDGIFDGDIIEDTTILTFQEARRRAVAEVTAYGNPTVNIRFVTNKAGLHAGQIIHVIDANRGINDDYLIQKISRKSKEGAKWEYTVDCASTMFGLIEFFQLLLKKSRRMGTDLSELVDIVVNQDETISINPVFVFTKKSNIVTAASTRVAKWFDFIECAGTRTANNTGRIFNTNKHRNNMWQSTISAAMTATVWFDAASRYNTQKALFINVASYSGGSTGKFAQASLMQRITASAATNYKLSGRLENLASNGIVWWLGATIEIVEYAAFTGWAAIATTQLISWYSAYTDRKNFFVTFTTDPTTAYFDVVFRIDESTGRVSIGDILLEELAAESQPNPGIASFCEAT